MALNHHLLGASSGYEAFTDLSQWGVSNWVRIWIEKKGAEREGYRSGVAHGEAT